MSHPNSQPQRESKPKRNPLATTLAAVATFVGMPLLHNLTVGLVEDFTLDQYGYGWLWIADPLAWVGSAALVFFSVRALAPNLFDFIRAGSWLRLFR